MGASPLVLLHLDKQTYLQFTKVMSCINERLLEYNMHTYRSKLMKFSTMENMKFK